MLNKSRIFALALVPVMLFTNAVFASEPPTNETGTTTASEEFVPGTSSIRKILRMPVGTITPNVTFEFEFDKISVDGKTSTEALATMPNLIADNMKVSFTTDDTDPNEPVNNIISIVKDTGNIFAGATFPHAGIFIYEISETAKTNSAIDNNAPHEVLTYSKAAYRVKVYVANTANFSETYVNAISITPIAAGNGNEIENGEKTGQMIFVNDFVRTNGAKDPENPDPVRESTLGVSKTVTGDLANRELYFDFSMTLDIPTLVVDVPEYFRAYVVENNAVVDPSNNANAALIGTDAGGKYIMISTEKATEFSLKHGQRLVFVDTPVGTAYTVAEDGAAGYTPSFIITRNGAAGSPVTGELGQPLGTGDRLVGELANSAAFTNSRSSVVPTGVNLNNLPFIGLIALPLGALCGFIILKTRRRNSASRFL